MSFMMIPIGRKPYGRMHAHGGEYAVTQFFHVCSVPLIPLASFWVTNAPGSTADRGRFPIKLNRRSVVATYLRLWLLLPAFALLLAPSLITTALGLALVAVIGWSWTRGAHRGRAAWQQSVRSRRARAPLRSSVADRRYARPPGAPARRRARRRARGCPAAR
jgi:cellulose synthase/poly-beta-1,6-N-acetylglucosamine synthase-like glycosyltransferase